MGVREEGDEWCVVVGVDPVGIQKKWGLVTMATVTLEKTHPAAEGDARPTRTTPQEKSPSSQTSSSNQKPPAIHRTLRISGHH